MDLILSVEEARRARRMSQAQIAEALEITQGHYSKVVASRAALSVRLAERMEAWLASNDRVTLGSDATRRIHSLAASIRRECMELMHLVGLTEGGDL
jgi:transcriptional regulator with XRE-family HTH domain